MHPHWRPPAQGCLHVPGEIVPLALCRYDMGVEVPERATIGDGVSETRFPPMKVAEIDIARTVELELRALDWLCTTWLPRSGFEPDRQPGFEAFVREPLAHGETHFTLCVQLPQPARPQPCGPKVPAASNGRAVPRVSDALEEACGIPLTWFDVLHRRKSPHPRRMGGAACTSSRRPCYSAGAGSPA